MKPPSTIAELRYYARRAGAEDIEAKLTAMRFPYKSTDNAFVTELTLLLEQAYLDGVADGKAERP